MGHLNCNCPFVDWVKRPLSGQSVTGGGGCPTLQTWLPVACPWGVVSGQNLPDKAKGTDHGWVAAKEDGKESVSKAGRWLNSHAVELGCQLHQLCLPPHPFPTQGLELRLPCRLPT